MPRHRPMRRSTARGFAQGRRRLAREPHQAHHLHRRSRLSQGRLRRRSPSGSPNVRPVSTGLVVAGLPLPELIVQIDAEAAIPSQPVRAHAGPTRFDSWHGQGFRLAGRHGALPPTRSSSSAGRPAPGLDHSGNHGGPRPRSRMPRAQADLALQQSRHAPGRGWRRDGGCLQDHVYISDRAYRPAVYPMIGKHFADVRPVSTGIVTTGFARPEILFEIDVAPAPQGRRAASALAPLSFERAQYGTEQQTLDCEFCMAVRAGRPRHPARPDRHRPG